MNSATYQFHYHEYSVYSNVVGLITEFGARDGVHLDIGCGYGAIAEPVRDLGLTYIGFDADEDSLRDLRSRGFEAKRIDLHRLDEVFAEIAATVNGRNVASISIIDTLEHITNGPALLDRLREFAEQRSILLVVSVPNGGHRDLGAKLLAGHWIIRRLAFSITRTSFTIPTACWRQWPSVPAGTKWARATMSSNPVIRRFRRLIRC
ncbi:hypothetical protein BMMON2_21830 [Burkholderia mallei]